MNNSKIQPDNIAPTIAPRTGFPRAPAMAPTRRPIPADGSAIAMGASNPTQVSMTPARATAPTPAPTIAPVPDTFMGTPAPTASDLPKTRPRYFFLGSGTG